MGGAPSPHRSSSRGVEGAIRPENPQPSEQPLGPPNLLERLNGATQQITRTFASITALIVTTKQETGSNEEHLLCIKMACSDVTMLFFQSSPFQPLRSVSIGCLLASLNLVVASASTAQVPDVVKPAPDGDFPSISVSGFRGIHPQRYWLVVDRDPRGLLCRDGQGRGLIALKYGSVIETDLSPASPSPLSFQQGKSVVRVRVQPMHLLFDARLKHRGTPTTCNVRANTSFIAPVNGESIAVLCKGAAIGEPKPPFVLPKRPEKQDPGSGFTP